MNDPSSAISTATSENNSCLASNNQVQDSSSSIPFQSELQTSGTSNTSPLGKKAIYNNRNTSFSPYYPDGLGAVFPN